ncbi:hypothetical protein MNB_SV-15-761 [hydrothermal vent metagenome]|uniref:Nudix hydrolase domain-containing protein n=1 Tax=hydrothermal vent metagenome TaxID=652676 RepID=A0A1W1EK66_9ZZZZ
MKIIKKEFDNSVEDIWKSKEVNFNGDPFMSIKKSRDYYIYAERVGIDSIAFILYDKNKNRFALIQESKPPLDTNEYLVSLVTAFGGSMDIDITPQEICKIEVEEEAGYEVELEKIHFVGESLVSTQMSQICKLFLVDVTDNQKTKKAEYEIENKHQDDSIIWLNRDEVMDNGDWKSIYIISKMDYLGIE